MHSHVHGVLLLKSSLASSAGCFAWCLMCLLWLQHWLEDDDLDKVMKNYDENGDGGLLSACLYGQEHCCGGVQNYPFLTSAGMEVVSFLGRPACFELSRKALLLHLLAYHLWVSRVCWTMCAGVIQFEEFCKLVCPCRCRVSILLAE